MQPTQTALLAGSTGLVGSHLLDLLLAAPEYDGVKALTRRPLERTHDKLQTEIVDFDDLASHGDALAADDVFCCLGTTIKTAGSREAFRRVDHHYVFQLARLARDAGARRFVMVSSVGADASAANFYLRVKGEVERDVGELGYSALHILRPSLLLGARKEFRLGERLGILAMHVVGPFFVGPLAKYRGISAGTVAAAMLGSARQVEEGRHVHDNPAIERLARHPKQ